MTQEALKMSQEALAGLKDVEKQVRELIAENKALKEALREHAMREVQRLGQEIEQECWCTTCRPITMADMRFVVCPDCGNKRCPKANDHRNACTNSNEVGQEGSSWEHVKPLAQHDSVQAKPEPELCKYGQEPKSCTSSPMDCQCAIDAALAQPEHKCNSHPKAPHGFNRNASHANDRYTCECESWDAYEAGYQAGVTAGIEMSTETEQKPVAWLGFNERGECREVFTPKMKETFPNYPTADMIPVYTNPPNPEQEPVAMVESVATVVSESGNQEVTMSWWHEPALPVGTKLYTTPPKRKPLTSREIRAIEVEVAMSNSFAHPTKAEEFARAIEAAHGIRD